MTIAACPRHRPRRQRARGDKGAKPAALIPAPGWRRCLRALAEQVFGASAEPRLRDIPLKGPRNAGITSQLCAVRVAECAG